MNTDYIIQFHECRHLQPFARAQLPSEGDDVFCLRCREYRRVLHVVGQYTTRCVSPGCKYRAAWGARRYTAQRRADAHARTHGHVVELLLGSTKVSTHGNARDNAVQLSLDDAPPF